MTDGSTGSTGRAALLARLRAQRVLPVLRLPDAATTLAAVDCLHETGFRVFEVTMTTPGAEALIEQVVRERPDSLVGAGTVTDLGRADACIGRGASFVVSPYLVAGLARRCAQAGRLAVVGAFTPGEVAAAIDEGADVVKVFPASTGGPAHVAALASVFPGVPLCPTGGIDDTQVAAYLGAGAALVGAGSQLVDRAALLRGDRSAAIERARRYLQHASHGA
ncbi:MAG: bifunctional 4-hydroxy-2-oxoglutarate aldolase/2-dehydro-3-deoxy-phosphogluconate aldolase [Lautropia sp.]|nr:bifunctional 4-hydroxy-2-oxoglutarate aldolase/2-dehydro-3-deoxy-phosphogluconate aldolase [Lautropia sp.]MCL4701672.1 bifunctional 4-hydroxy-2-oxoglutarate aldolase/2-dehydro-3-deoxy-phosphogluconate aldolase [Burkholderiaceae bacterium]MCZ2096794.1 bifunctional 4-hydroxy-2-oxoglutarate aldolase/2-dehydro-3-deoxy-phosphogluconate aldolase [Anaerolineae bacterium]MDL1906585.1 bifunctional 4-hydroxy-2-oxoglutarate aldolase/2-dehydro-3-deoxy-phosphogluconate aldolase [Betaproteobacteria bacteri